MSRNPLDELAARPPPGVVVLRVPKTLREVEVKPEQAASGDIRHHVIDSHREPSSVGSGHLCCGEAVAGTDSEHVALLVPHHADLGVAQPGGDAEHLVEHRLQLGGRAADDLERRLGLVGRWSTTRAPTPACTAMTDIEWATTSWSSWAMRRRSSAIIRADRCRSTLARSSASRTVASTVSRRARTASVRSSSRHRDRPDTHRRVILIRESSRLMVDKITTIPVHRSANTSAVSANDDMIRMSRALVEELPQAIERPSPA